MTKFLLAGAALLTTAPLLAAPAPSGTAAANSPAAVTNSPSADSADQAIAAPTTSPTANSPASTTTTAAASGNVAVGATVTDPKGAKVGTIESVEGQYAVLATAKNKVRLPLSSFGKGAEGPVIALTEAQVDAAASAAGKTGTP